MSPTSITSMRAAAVDEFGPPASLKVSEHPIPEPGDEEVSIDVDYAGVGFVDTLFRAGAFPLSTPLIPGIEVTGRVRAVGSNVDGLLVGQRVAALLNDFGRTQRAGGYAEVAVAHQTMAATVPVGADLRRITAIISNGVAGWIALHDIARLEARDVVLILGASGGLGATTARLAALHPAAQVIGVVSGDPARAPRECTEVILAEELDARLAEVSSAGTVDVVIDPVGGSLRSVAYEHLAPFGRHLVLGNASSDDQPFSGDEAWLETRVIAGLSIGRIAHLRPELIAEALSAVISLVSSGTLEEPLPTVEPLENAPEVHAALEQRTAPAKTILSLEH